MRVSELLAREPFGSIFQKTLSEYWTNQYSLPVDLFWANSRAGKQVWRGNSYLNFFCTSDVDPCCFQNIVREFSYSRVLWRRFLQTSYARAATSGAFRSLFSNLYFSVSEFIPDAPSQIILGGRNRLRILHPRLRQSIVIAKAGFDKSGFENEIFVRQHYVRDVAPAFYGLIANGLAFSEEYITGTPANRFSSQYTARFHYEALQHLTVSLHEPTLRCVPLVQYTEYLVSTLTSFSTLSGSLASQILLFISQICSSTYIGTSMTHGDFQSANILVSTDKVRIIDWETVAVRSQFYDVVTLFSSIRLSSDKFLVWREYFHLFLSSQYKFPNLLVSVDDRYSIVGHLVVWLLEESIFQLQEARCHPQLNHSFTDSIVHQGLNTSLLFLSSYPL